MLNNNYVSVTVIVNEGRASDVMDHMKKKNLVSGATAMLGQGTAKSEILRFFELHHQRKELFIMAVKREYEEEVMKELEVEFNLNKKNQGISFSTDVIKTSWERNTDQEEIDMGPKSGFEALFVIVDRGVGDEVVEIANDAGAKGATIIHGRGTGTSVMGNVFDMVIEPEKDIVLLLIVEENIDSIMDVLYKELELEKQGKGIMFTMDVNRTAGILK